jgi:quercetin dioxygenase-like cupin family protein
LDIDSRAYTLSREEGRAVWFLGTLSTTKATGEQTGGAFGLVEQLIPAGFASPYHVHRDEDESFYVLEGEATFICDGQELKARSGTYIFGPRGIPHGFRVEGSAPARMLFLATPSGFERFVEEVGEPAKELTLPPPQPPDMEKLMTLAEKHHIEILGPLPE